MRRENRKGLKEDGFDVKKILYISGSILAVAIIGFVIAFLVYGNSMEQNSNLGKLNTNRIDSYAENTEAASSEFGKTINEMEIEAERDNTNTTKYAVNTSNVEGNTIKENSTSNTVKSKEGTNGKKTDSSKENDTTKKDEKVKDPTFKKPVEGEVIREYAKEKLVYSNTLGEWITHNGIDIKANKTTVVKAAADGVVKSIKNDPRYGLTVVIEHVNGFTSVYSNLLTAEFVVEGENVKQGKTIGTVGTTANFEIADEPHLHFEIKKDGENLNPDTYIK